MKTLDEVITAMEMCIGYAKCTRQCPYFSEDCLNHDLEKDAVSYLKQYKTDKVQYEEARRLKVPQHLKERE